MSGRLFSRSVILFATLGMATGASADGGDFIGGLAVGIIGKALIDGASRQQQQRQQEPIYRERRVYEDPARAQRRAAERAEAKRRSEAEQQEMAAIQSRLNALNFSAGPPDGKQGSQTRKAIRDFQASLGTAQTGILTEQEKSMLIASTSSPSSATPASAQAPLTALAPLNPGSNSSLAATQATPVPSQLPPLSNTLPTPGNLAIGGGAATNEATAPDEAIFGVKPLQSREDAYRALSDANVASNCQDSENAIVCVKQGAQLTDEITVGTVKLDSASIVHTAVRTMTFNPPMERSKIVSLLNGKYPRLMNSPDRISSSGNECNQFAQPYRAGDFAKLKDWVKSGRQADDGLSKFSTRCEYYHEISMPAGDMISAVSIALFAGKPIVNSLTEVGSMDTATSGLTTATAPTTTEIPF